MIIFRSLIAHEYWHHRCQYFVRQSDDGERQVHLRPREGRGHLAGGHHRHGRSHESHKTSHNRRKCHHESGVESNRFEGKSRSGRWVLFGLNLIPGADFVIL